MQSIAEGILKSLTPKECRVDKDGNRWEKCPATTNRGKGYFLFCRNALGENKHLWIVYNWILKSWLVKNESLWNGYDYVSTISIKVDDVSSGLKVARELIRKSTSLQ